jgi:hypothetical protein
VAVMISRAVLADLSDHGEVRECAFFVIGQPAKLDRCDVY